MAQTEVKDTSTGVDQGASRPGNSPVEAELGFHRVKRGESMGLCSRVHINVDVFVSHCCKTYSWELFWFSCLLFRTTDVIPFQ